MFGHLESMGKCKEIKEIGKQKFNLNKMENWWEMQYIG
jgi:hypothetical protein